MNNYVVLDLENPNTRGNSICAIAVIVVRNNEIIDKKYSLINPEDRFDEINSRITGIQSNMILNQPTLKDFWQEIKDSLSNNVIVGHNVSYDLNVLANALDRYDMEVPGFKYCCTLKLSQQYLDLDSYSLPSIAKALNIDYNPHNALEDAKATYCLYGYINDNFKPAHEIKEYNHVFALREKLDSKLSTNINKLFGIVEGINYDGVIEQKEINLLKKWVEENTKYKQYALFNKILTKLTIILEDNSINDYEKLELINLIHSINSSNIYSETTLGMQILQGIIEGISSDEKIAIEEIKKFQTWLKNNDYLSGVYPYDKIVLIINNVLDDNILTNEEKEELVKIFNEILCPAKQNNLNIEFENKTFCLTGEFKNGSKSEIKQKLESLGAIEKSGVNSKLDYLFVGGVGSDAWKYGNFGGKVLKAQELNEKGSKIQIICEDDLFCKI